MTKARYLRGCAPGSQAGRIQASSPAVYAWIVNLNNGNSNINNQDNDYFVRAVRSSEYRNVPCFRSLHAAWCQARCGKKPSPNQLNFEGLWMDGLLRLERELSTGTWSPKKTTCFIAKSPKAREIHAPDFSDRIVHHWLVPQLEAIYEPVFIHDSYSNRRGKGTHAAVERLRDFVHQVESGQCGGHYLQLDVANFFNSIHRPTLYALLKRRMERFALPLATRRATHALLRRSPAEQGVTYVCTRAEHSAVPAHKRLENAAPGCGIAIGNLSSQFFANVYLNELDQFVKHDLRAPRYLRYVDDFVLVHRDPEQLQIWQHQIAGYLRDRLRLQLKADIKLRPLSAGIDFLGYVVFPRQTVVRRRVIGHTQQKLATWAHKHIRQNRIHATPDQIRQLQAVHDSYAGHFSHADSYRLRARVRRRFPWLETALLPRQSDHTTEHRMLSIAIGAAP